MTSLLSFSSICSLILGFPGVSPGMLVVKNLPAKVEDKRDVGLIPGFLVLGWEDPLEEGMATHSSILT